ncbi:hypothetical protein A2U01_0103609 [Trifolium medium]|uniref:Uncharacterized protein n=1 Tax=Trifolium medium TaxID=97028 RepID=A0A392V667_9FABA|nr:hypothetical protein [Trifolium medium]
MPLLGGSRCQRPVLSNNLSLTLPELEERQEQEDEQHDVEMHEVES